jgi:UDP:flavonoid glycosyltransferase YjiC (YdhE family)
MLPAVGAACDEWRPDLILREAAEYASAIAAERRGLPHAQVAIGLAEVEWSSLALAGPALEDYGGQIVPRLLAAPYLTRLPASLDPSPFTSTLRFRESAGPPPSALPDWWDGDQSPLVFVSFATIAGRLPTGVAAYQAVITAVTGLPVRVLLTTGRTREAAELGPVPHNVHVESWVPQQDVLPHASVAVIHGGAGTTFGALAAGVPLVLVPIMADQPANARLVAAAGAGIAVEPDSGPAAPAAPGGPAGNGPAGNGPAGNGPAGPQIRAAVETILADASYRQAAERIAAEMRAAPAIDQVLGTLAASLR